MFRKRLADILGELEDINYHIQNSVIDPSLLEGITGDLTPDQIRNLADADINLAFSAIDNLIDKIYGEKQ